MNRLSSTKYRDGARGQPCTFRIPGVCDGGGETTIFAHIRDRHTGRGLKASDISGGDCCFGCHEVFDGRVPQRLLSLDDWRWYALRALQETLENRIERKILGFPHDPPPKPVKVKVRKPKAERQKIVTRPFQKGQSRPIPARAFPKRGKP